MIVYLSSQAASTLDLGEICRCLIAFSSSRKSEFVVCGVFEVMTLTFCCSQNGVSIGHIRYQHLKTFGFMTTTRSCESVKFRRCRDFTEALGISVVSIFVYMCIEKFQNSESSSISIFPDLL